MKNVKTCLLTLFSGILNAISTCSRFYRNLLMDFQAKAAQKELKIGITCTPMLLCSSESEISYHNIRKLSLHSLYSTVMSANDVGNS